MKNYKNWLWVIGAVLITTSLFAQSNPALQKANKYYDLHTYKSAITEYKKVLSVNPDNAQALSRLGRSYYYTNRMERAAEYLQKALRTTQQDINDFYFLGQSLRALQRYDDAKKAFQTYGRENPERADQLAKSCDYAKQMKAEEAFFKVQKEYLNTADSDFGATYLNRKVVYSSARTDIKSNINDGGTDWTGQAPNKLLVTRVDRNGKLQLPELLKKSFKAKTNEGPLSFTPDGNFVVYTKNNFSNGVRQIPQATGALNLFLAEVKGEDDWREEKAFPYNSTNFSTGYPYISSDGNKLYFASNRPGGYGGFDLYVTSKRGNSWTTPQNLGPEFNTPGNEISPFIEGNTMYFASDWHLGFGGYDMFMASSVGSGWGNIVNLGKGINSSYDDFGFIFNSSKDYGYFTSNRPGGKGNEDIYGAKRQKPVSVAINPPKEPEMIPTEMNAEIVELLVLSEFNKTPISNAIIDFRQCGQKVYTTNSNGIYKFRTEGGIECDVEVSKQGYETKLIKFSTINKSNRSIEIMLNRIDGRYYGVVVDQLSKKPQTNVKITATNLTSKARMEAMTNSEGRYALGLSNNSEYVVQFSKAQYLITTLKVNTGDGSNKNILGIQPIRPSAAVVITETPPGDPNNNNNDARNPDVTTNDREINTSKRPLPVAAYELQIGTFKSPNQDALSRLDKFGYVYYEAVNDFRRYKIGVFRTKMQALAVKESIIKELGIYKDAFVTVTKDKALINRAFVEDANNLPPGTVDKPAVDDTPMKPNMPSKYNDPNAVVYKVQLGVYSNPKNFDDSKIKSLGMVQTQPRRLNDGRVLTVILLGDYKTKAAASEAKTKAQQLGIPQPFVVVYKGNKRI